MYLSFWLGSIVIGLGFTGLVVSAYLTFRVLNFPDLTVDGSYPLGGAIAAVLILQGTNPWVTLPFVLVAGGMAGVVTGLLVTRLGINGILAGILVAIAMYSINLHVLGGVANLPIFGHSNVMATGEKFFENSDIAAAAVFGAVVIFILLFIAWFLTTEVGLAMRAVGNNEQMARAQGVNPEVMKLLGLFIANALAALSGALQVQYMGFADVNIGLGIILSGIAALIMGEALIWRVGLFWTLVAVVVGSIAYRLGVSVSLYIGLHPNDIKIGTVVIVLIFLALPKIRAARARFVDRRRKSPKSAAVGSESA